jgi:hypothetical protein
MAHLISAQLIARHEAWLAHRSIYLPSMSYSLPSTSFTRRELANIQSSPIRALLSAMGFSRNMPREVVFGPNATRGIGLRHLHVEQGCQKTSALSPTKAHPATQPPRQNDVGCNPVDPSHSRSWLRYTYRTLEASTPHSPSVIFLSPTLNEIANT